jgi:hypothetical protein
VSSQRCDGQERLKDLHEGKYVCLWEAPETILMVVDWETEIKEVPRLGNVQPQYVYGDTFVACKRVFGPGLDCDQVIDYVRHGKTSSSIRLEDLTEPNPMLLLAYIAASP